MAYDHQASFLKKPKKTAGEAEVDDTYEEFTQPSVTEQDFQTYAQRASILRDPDRQIYGKLDLYQTRVDNLRYNEAGLSDFRNFKDF